VIALISRSESIFAEQVVNIAFMRQSLQVLKEAGVTTASVASGSGDDGNQKDQLALTVYRGMGHSSCDEEVAAMHAFISKCLPPLAQS
jgi:hypothetical protein